MNMVERSSLAGLVLVIIGLFIVIVQALNMGDLLDIEALLRSLGLVLIGMAVQLLGLSLILIGKKKDTL